MTIVSCSAFDGEWYHQGSRPLLKTQKNTTPDIATCDIQNLSVTSEKASDGLNTRSILLFLEGATSTEAAGQVRPCSTANVVWRTPVAIEVLGITRYSLALEEMATCDNFVVYGNNGTCIGGILLKAGTTNPAAYTRTCSGALTRTALAAGTNVLVQRLSSTCSVQGRSAIQLDYMSTG